MSNYINGIAYPIIQVRTLSDGVIYDTISLDLCMSGGLVESYEESFQTVVLENNKIITYDFRASRITFTLDYSEYVRKANLFLIEQIFGYNSLPDTYYLEIIPSSDLTSRVFRVVLADGQYSLAHLSGGVLSKGHKLPVIKFITVDTVGKNFIDQDLLYVALPFCSVA
jgi:hypothetical protein